MNDRLFGKNILFISTKDKGYIRNQQEINLLKSIAGLYDEIVFYDKSYIKRILKVYLACLKGIWRKADVIFIGFAPQLLILFLRHWYRKKYVVIDFFISLYDTFVCDRKCFKKYSLAAKFLHWIDEYTLHQCDHIIVDTLADQGYFSEEFHIPFRKMEVMYLEADTNIYDDKRFSQQQMTVLYFGSMLPLQGVDVILSAAKRLKHRKDIIFSIIGPVSKKNSFHESDYPNVNFYDWMSQEQLAKHIAQADLCLAGHFNKKIEKAKRTIPGKAYIYEAMKKPMVLGDNEANKEIFREDSRHFYVPMGSPKALAEKITVIKEYAEKKRGGNGYEICSTASLSNEEKCAKEIILIKQKQSGGGTNKRILEIGYGAGEIFNLYRELGFQVEGYDFSKIAYNYATKHYADRNILLHKTKPKAVHQFDYVVACEVLEHIQNDVETLKEWKKYLKDTGKMIISIPAHQNRWGDGDVYAGHVRRYERMELKKKFRMAGMKVEQVYTYDFPMGLVLEYVRNKSLKKKLKRGDARSTQEKLTKKSGVERDFHPVVFALSHPALWVIIIKMQEAFYRTDLGSGYILMASPKKGC